jgi:hypothetical protein
MRLEPRLLGGLDRPRRDRIVSRTMEAATLASGQPAAEQPAREARQILGALAMVEGRWDDALAALSALADDEGLTPAERADVLLAAGDLLAGKRGDPAGAERMYERAALASPHDPRLALRVPRGK